ncbi:MULTISPECIES: hypothetical protein [Streptomyces]|nr:MULTISPECIES: hypothetical protein [Streptomyces]UVN55400.1 hypothetical protein NR995_13330 [Streptomyces albus]
MPPPPHGVAATGSSSVPSTSPERHVAVVAAAVVALPAVRGRFSR